jgi:hypothetical protein
LIYSNEHIRVKVYISRTQTNDFSRLSQVLRQAEPLRTAAELDAFTGLRRGELIGLQWENVDFENLVIHVRRSVVMVVFAHSEQRRSEGGTGAPTSCERSHYAGSLRSGGKCRTRGWHKENLFGWCSTRERHWPNWTKLAMTQIANSLQVLERIGGDDGTRTRGLCRDRAAF